MALPEQLTISTADGVTLEAEVVRATDERARLVLCHPHPQHGGSMRSLVTGALFDSLPDAGVTCLRFNFRGVGASGGEHGGGVDETHDAQAALDRLVDVGGSRGPLVACGWSFGADMALGLTDERLAGWIAVACPLRYGNWSAAASDPRPKWLILGSQDEIVAVDSVRAATRSWTSTRTDEIPGASHFFVGRTDHVVASALDALRTMGADLG